MSQIAFFTRDGDMRDRGSLPIICRRASGQAPALYEVGPFPLRMTLLRPGPEDDRQLVELYCVGCHSTTYIATQPPSSARDFAIRELQRMQQQPSA